MLVYGIPELRLPKALVQLGSATVEALGVAMRINSVVGRMVSVDKLLGEDDTVFVGPGAGLPTSGRSPGRT
ncbi:MAG: hypothetical protein E6933_14040 [Clostridiales bacterium]|nr:hypothetical protein [Clostridiales bacterium]